MPHDNRLFHHQDGHHGGRHHGGRHHGGGHHGGEHFHCSPVHINVRPGCCTHGLISGCIHCHGGHHHNRGCCHHGLFSGCHHGCHGNDIVVELLMRNMIVNQNIADQRQINERRRNDAIQRHTIAVQTYQTLILSIDRLKGQLDNGKRELTTLDPTEHVVIPVYTAPTIQTIDNYTLYTVQEIETGLISVNAAIQQLQSYHNLLQNQITKTNQRIAEKRLLNQHREFRNFDQINQLLPLPISMTQLPLVDIDGEQLTLPELAIQHGNEQALITLIVVKNYPLSHSSYQKPMARPLDYIANNLAAFQAIKWENYRSCITLLLSTVLRANNPDTITTIYTSLKNKNLITDTQYQEALSQLPDPEKLKLLAGTISVQNGYAISTEVFKQYYAANQDLNFAPSEGTPSFQLAQYKAYLNHCTDIKTILNITNNHPLCQDPIFKPTLIKMAKNRVLRLISDNPRQTIPADVTDFMKQVRTHYFFGLIPGAFFYTSSTAILSNLKQGAKQSALNELHKQETKVTSFESSLNSMRC